MRRRRLSLRRSAAKTHARCVARVPAWTRVPGPAAVSNLARRRDAPPSRRPAVASRTRGTSTRTCVSSFSGFKGTDRVPVEADAASPATQGVSATISARSSSPARSSANTNRDSPTFSCRRSRTAPSTRSSNSALRGWRIFCWDLLEAEAADPRRHPTVASPRRIHASRRPVGGGRAARRSARKSHVATRECVRAPHPSPPPLRGGGGRGDVKRTWRGRITRRREGEKERNERRGKRT